ncbi:MAG: hypothetical protein ABSA83_03180 [Verrucomicrobiota bacterium]|jgi:hypothetical protein
MTEHIFWIRLLPIPVILVVLIFYVVIPRIRMERRAKSLLAQMPSQKRKTVYLAFTSIWCFGKKKEMEAKIIEEEKSGWTFLKAREANFLKTLRTSRGGLNLHFIKKA